MFKKILKKLSGFFKPKAVNPEKVPWLDRSKVPSFIKIANHYEVVVGPEHVGSAPFHLDEFYLYGVRNIYEGGRVRYFKCPFKNLPKRFWVRKVLAAYAYYQFIPDDDKNALMPSYPSVE